MADKTTNYNLTKPSASEFYDIDVQNANMDIIDAEMKNLNDGIADAKNQLSDVNSKAVHAETSIEEHSRATNPHNVTALQVGLGNVPNVATNDQTPTYTESSTLATLTSGEKLSIAFGKIKKAITDLMSHLGNTTIHLTANERQDWNAKAPGNCGLGKNAVVYNNKTNAEIVKSGCGFFGTISGQTTVPTEFGDTGATIVPLLQWAYYLDSYPIGFQITGHYNPDSMWFRQISAGYPQAWKEFIHSGNIEDYKKVQVGTYVGNGNYGDKNPNTIQCDFKPYLAIVYRHADKVPTIMSPDEQGAFFSYANATSGGVCYCEVDENNVLSWYNGTQRWKTTADWSTEVVGTELETIAADSYSTRQYYQLNISGTRYTYIILGE